MKYLRGKPLEPGEKRAIVSVDTLQDYPALGRTGSRRTFEKPNFKKFFIISYEIFKSTFSFANIYRTLKPNKCQKTLHLVKVLIYLNINSF